MLEKFTDHPTDSLADSFAARARALRAEILAQADATERNRQVSAALMEKIHAAQLLRMLIPRSLGGGQTDLMSFVEAVEDVARADASTAWCVGQGNGCAFGAAFLAPEIAREVFGAAEAVVASGPSNATARALAVPGGYRVSGQWRYASGSRNAQWLGAHCNVFETDGSPRVTPPGKVAQMTVLFPKSKAVVTDVWRVMGLNGTGSDDYAVEDLFVPAEFSYTRDFAGDRREDGTLYRFSNFNIFGFAFAGVACGIARTMLDEFVALAGRKKPNAAGGVLSANAAVQQQVGFNEARLQSVRAYLFHTLEAAWDKVERTGECSSADRISLRMMSAFVIQSAKEVADFAYHAAGANAIFEDNPFERRFRDINVVTQQGQAHMSNFEAAGQLYLGHDASFRR